MKHLLSNRASSNNGNETGMSGAESPGTQGAGDPRGRRTLDDIASDWDARFNQPTPVQSVPAQQSQPVVPPHIVDVRVRSIDLPFDELLLLSIKLIGVQLVLGLVVGLILVVLGVF